MAHLSPADMDLIQDLQMKANKTTDETLESTRRMLTLCDESNDCGIRTLVALDEQGEQLDRIERDMDMINDDMRETEKHLTEMEKWCGVCLCPCGRNKEFREDPNAWQLSTEMGAVVSGQPMKGDVYYKPGKQHGGSVDSVNTGYVKRITGDARENEMEDNMGVVNQMIGNLRNMAIDIGGEIDNQNVQIDKINLKAQSNTERIQDANERAQKLM